ncbi:MAG: di-trans,poly-cis-decaprenylcistransferase [Chromatiales bacterium]|jgi:undecaprenyl diphosphate synthase|nr:di-trans,poly-cis-decaprenylcistransferase [Chromatiales bacterium]
MSAKHSSPPDLNSGEPDIILPRHVAIIMDGNGRWATRRRSPRFAGHRAGVNAVREVVQVCVEKRIEVLTLFAFSSENWRRPPEEVGSLMNLFISALQSEMRKLHENNIRLNVIGERGAFSPELQTMIAEAESLMSGNTGLNLFIAANYGGRWDVVQAARQLAQSYADGAITLEDIDEVSLTRRVALGHMPEPDLFIRTGGEKRISNFMLWQLAYTELFFTEALWPDFDRRAFEGALASFAARQRRYGQTGEQVSAAER